MAQPASPGSPIPKTPIPRAGGTASGQAGLAAPGISLTLATRASGSQQHPLPWCGMGAGMGSPVPTVR